MPSPSRLASQLEAVLQHPPPTLPIRDIKTIQRADGAPTADAKWSVFACLVASILFFVDFAISRYNVDSFIAGIVAFTSFLVFMFLTHRLSSFPITERQRAIRRLIAKLNALPTNHDNTIPFLSPNYANNHNKIHVFRDEKWSCLPRNLLVTGDIVALPAHRCTPARVKRVDAPFDILERDTFVTETPALSSTWFQRHVSSSPDRVFALRTVQMASLSFFEVLESPLVQDITVYLSQAEQDQKTTMGNNLYLISSFLNVARVFVFLIFVAVGAIRWTVYSDTGGGVHMMTWSHLMLARPATLLLFFPPITNCVVRILLDSYYLKRTLSFQKQNGRGSSSVIHILRRWLFHTTTTNNNNDDEFHMPLCPSALVGILGSVTSLCSIDEDALLSPVPGVEEVFLLKGEDKFVVVDCCTDSTAPFGVRFEDPRWRQHASSLKPIGLACALGSTRVKPITPPRNSTSLAPLLQTRMPPSELKSWAWTIGFRDGDVNGFVPKRHWIVVNPRVHLSRREASNHARKFIASWSTFHDRPCMDGIVFEPPPPQAALAVPSPLPPVVPPQPVPATTPSNSSIPTPSPTPLPSHSLFMAWGHTSFMLKFCTDYWDGESIWPLGDNTRKLVKDMSERWAKEGFDAVAFSYAPVLVHGGDIPVVSATPQPVTNTSTTPSCSVSPPSTTTTDGMDSPVICFFPTAEGSPPPSPTTTSSPMPEPSVIPHHEDHGGVTSLANILARGANIFTGMIGSRDQPLPDVVSLASDAHKAGIRFVYFSPRDPTGARILAAQMGLETDWNTSISLRETPLVEASSSRPPSRTSSRPPSRPEFPPPGPPPPPSSSLPLHRTETENSQHLHGLDPGPLDWELKAKMPRGLVAIKNHLAHVDDVPLRVSVFTDSAPSEVCNMIQIMRDYGETVCAFVSAPARGTTLADVAIEIRDESIMLVDPIEAVSREFSALGCSVSLCKSQSRTIIMDVLGEGRVAYFNFRQAAVVFASFCGVVAIVQMTIFCLTTPDLFTPLHCLWLVWIPAPMVSWPVAFRPRDRDVLLRNRMPWKNSASHTDARFYPRFLTYALVRLVPVIIFVILCFCWALNENWTALIWGNVTMLPPSSNQIMAAQSITLLALVWSMCVVSATMASRVDWEMERGFWQLWGMITISVMAIQVMYNCAYAAAATGECGNAFWGVPQTEWIVVALVPPVLFTVVAIPTKSHDSKIFKHSMMLLKLDFETKLGQFSPSHHVYALQSTSKHTGKNRIQNCKNNMPDVFAFVGIGGGLFASFCGLAHCWPLVTPNPGYNSLLHIITAWALMPLGLLLAIRDAHQSGTMNARSVMGTHFDAAFDVVALDAHFVIFLIWASLASLSFGGLYGMLGFLLCFARGMTLIPFVKEKLDMAMNELKIKLEEKNIKIPGFTDPQGKSE